MSNVESNILHSVARRTVQGMGISMGNESRRRLWVQIIILAVALEILTLVLRFGLKLDSTRDTASTIGRLTFGVRIHHGYCGAVIVLVGWSLSQTHRRLSRILYVVGWALFISDAVHHFLVLWPITGSPQFDLLYPEVRR